MKTDRLPDRKNFYSADMRKAFLFPLLFLCGTPAFTQDYWVQKDSVNGPGKSVSSAFTANGIGYVVGGIENASFTRKMYSYDPLTNDWDNEQSMGGADGGGLSRGSAVAFSAINRGYVCTGQGDNSNFLSDLWEYDPVADLWTQKADFPGSARRGAVSFVIDDIAYIGTGEDVNGLCNDFYKYDPVSNLWGNVAPFSGTPRKQAVGFTMGGQGYVGTGFDGTAKNDFWQYLVFQNMWVQKASLPGNARTGATGWAIFPTAFIATGENASSVYLNDVWEYNYFTNQWTQRATLPASGRRQAISFTLDGVAYLGTGYNGDALDDFYAYYQVTGTPGEEAEVSASVFPNPATGNHFTISTGRMLRTNDQLRFYAADGKDISDRFSVVRNGSSFAVSCTEQASGICWYAWLDQDGGIRSSGKIILQ